MMDALARHPAFAGGKHEKADFKLTDTSIADVFTHNHSIAMVQIFATNTT
jgi:hypothetical protein